MPVAALPSGPLPYRESGEPAAPTALLVHGVVVGSSVWSRVEAELTARGWRVIVPDIPLGCHRTAAGAAVDTSPAGIAEVLHELVEHLGLRGCTLVGNDTGGALCQFALDQDPSAFGSVVLTNCDAFTSFPPTPFGFFRWLGRHPRALALVYAPMRWSLARRVAYGLLAREAVPDEVTQDWWAPYFADAGVRRDAQRFLSAVDPVALDSVTRRLHRFAGPVTLCWAVEDRVFHRRLARRLHGELRDPELIWVTGSRTFVMWDRADAVADAVVSTANRSGPRSAADQ